MDIHVFWISDHIVDKALPPVQHTHKFFQMIYCKAGKGIITLSGKEYAMEMGKVYLAAPGVSHGFESTDSLEVIEFKFYAYGNFADKLKSLPHVFLIAGDSFMTKLLLKTVEEGFVKDEFCNCAVDAGLVFFFVRACENLIGKRRIPQTRLVSYIHLDAEEEETRDIDIIILKLRDYIEKHSDKEITLDELAGEAHFSKTYFVKRFREFWGMSPMKYVNNVRLEKAQSILTATDSSVLEIAIQTGFNSIHYFSRKFKEKYGVAPSEYRMQQKGKHEL
ncbi:MAG: helix-turn-helix transcriptional regulator [Oscillospiraceae bacterium]|nr:helix-turn-helix transcriptional regulator [Oscillospiraceae bacterium]